MTAFRSDYTRHTSSGAISQQFTNTDFRGKPDPSLSRPLENSRIVSNGTNLTMFADPGVMEVRGSGIYSHWPAAERNPDLDLTFDCYGADRLGNWNKGVGVVTLEAGGYWLNRTMLADPGEIVLSAEGIGICGILVNCESSDIVMTAHSYGMIIELVKNNWVKWSKIGSLDFTIDESNVANERPLKWYGSVYKILKLANTLVVYGEGGVTILAPQGIVYGMEELYNVGLLGKSSAAGTNKAHFFIDRSGKLFKVTSEGMKEIGYSEYLSQLTDPVMFIDQSTNLLHICDGTYGFIYNTKDESFGSGVVNLTGLDSRGSTRYATIPSTIAIPKFEICTGTYDMGTRKAKNIHSVEVGTDLSEHLKLLVEYRTNNREEFRKSPWFLVNPDGIAYSPCYGIEFRFRIRSFIVEQFQIDRLKINGSIHNFSYREYLAATKQDL